MDLIVIPDIPTAPSLNRCYQSVRRGRRSTIIATEEFRKYKSDMERFYRKNKAVLNLSSDIIHQWISEGNAIRFDMIVSFPESDLMTKTKKAKSKYKLLDADNRLKPTRDEVAKFLRIDDTVFFAGNTEKVIGEKCTTVVLTKHTPRELNQIKAALGILF